MTQETANWQKPKRETIRETCKKAELSERSFYRSRRLVRHNRPDLNAKVMSGELSTYGALQIAEGRQPPTKREKLVAAWNACPNEDHEWFIRQLSGDAEDGPP